MTRVRKVAVVTGANGFLARNLIPVLQKDGWRVVGITRDISVNDICETLTWPGFWAGRDLPPRRIGALIHLAAHIPPKMEDSGQASACLRTNALLTLRLAEHMA